MGSQRADQANEVAQLKAQLRRVEMARDILKKYRPAALSLSLASRLIIMYQFVE